MGEGGGRGEEWGLPICGHYVRCGRSRSSTDLHLLSRTVEQGVCSRRSKERGSDVGSGILRSKAFTAGHPFLDAAMAQRRARTIRESIAFLLKSIGAAVGGIPDLCVATKAATEASAAVGWAWGTAGCKSSTGERAAVGEGEGGFMGKRDGDLRVAHQCSAGTSTSCTEYFILTEHCGVKC